jgi:hypothetical protein
MNLPWGYGFGCPEVNASPRGRVARMPLADKAKSLVRPQTKLPAKPMMHGDHGTIDIADQAVAENDIGNFPVTADTDIGQSLNAGNECGFASRLIAQSLVRELGQLRTVFADLGHNGRNILFDGFMPAASSRDAWR